MESFKEFLSRDELKKRHFLEQNKKCNGGNLCKYGGISGEEVEYNDFELDRKTPGELGGKYTYENTQGLCSDCNIRKSDMPYEEWLELKKIGKI